MFNYFPLNMTLFTSHPHICKLPSGLLAKAVILIAMLSLSAITGNALPTDFYASSSALSQGKWARVQVKESGMQLISNSTLKSLGFTDPDKVNVYGFGGRMLSERLNESMPDDLPVVPSIRTPQGIVFFGHASILWSSHRGKLNSYTHVLNRYSEEAYYFISDRDRPRANPAEAEEIKPASGEPITVFTERLVHEQDLVPAINTGPFTMGEDFRQQAKRTFPFKLPGNTGEAIITVKFGAYHKGNASLMFTANNERLNSSSSDKIPSTGSTSYISTTTTTKNAGNVGESLNLLIELTSTATPSFAYLDYIEVEYPRSLKIDGNELYFYLSPTAASEVKVDGCSESTVIWDVTEPQNAKLVAHTLSGSTATFTAPAGYREFVAFNPAKINRSATAAGKVANQDIHGMESPDMLIISPDVYRQAAQRVADLHAETDGLKAVVLSPEAIYNEFSSGTPDVTAFRKVLKMWYDRASENDGRYARYCLIFSRPTYDNKRVSAIVRNCGYPRLPVWQSDGFGETSSYPTDDYIGMLDDNKTNLSMGSAKIHVAVGRMPVKSVSEANSAVAKLEKYVKSPNLGSWRNNVMVIADDQDDNKHLTQSEDAIDAMRKSGNGNSYLYEKLYLDSYPLVYTGTGAEYPAAKKRMFEKFAEGVCYVDYIGHANPRGWGHEHLLTWTELTSMTNTNLPFIYAATCEFLRWDDDAVSGGEEMWLNPNAGVIGMICPTRSVQISANGTQTKYTSEFVFKRDKDGKGMRVGDIMLGGKNQMSNTNKLPYVLIGDPAMRLPSPEYVVTVDSIDGVMIEGTDNTPEIKARSTVEISGKVTDQAGEILSDFDGTVDIQLFDAEVVIETYGNGEKGTPTTYNDRKTRLYVGKVKAVEGKWKTIVTLPMEIENNYSPAMISLYASDSKGREANGHTEQFYVYGFNDNISDDNEGPSITEFYLNSPLFSDGDAVSPAPLLIAKFADDSGINVSDAGIGHSMLVSLDGKNHFDDVTLYYTPDENNPLGGGIAYPLSGIEPGEHTLSFVVWDNANNSSTATLKFKVAAGWIPEIAELSTDVNPASTSVNFIVSSDGATGSMGCVVEVFNLSGTLVWSGTAPDMTANGTTVTLGWDLRDSSGNRVPRGIYLYRATITTPEGASITKTRKLAVTAK